MNRRTARGRGPKGDAGPLQAGLARVDTLIAAGQLADAVEMLAELDKRFHDNPEVLLRLLAMAVKADNVQGILAAAVPLARLRPDDPVVALNLAIARLKTRHLALAQRAFASFATRWPEHEQADQARWQANELAGHLAALWAENGLAGSPPSTPTTCSGSPTWCPTCSRRARSRRPRR